MKETWEEIFNKVEKHIQEREKRISLMTKLCEKAGVEKPYFLNNFIEGTESLKRLLQEAKTQSEKEAT